MFLLVLIHKQNKTKQNKQTDKQTTKQKKTKGYITLGDFREKQVVSILARLVADYWNIQHFLEVIMIYIPGIIKEQGL